MLNLNSKPHLSASPSHHQPTNQIKGILISMSHMISVKMKERLTLIKNHQLVELDIVDKKKQISLSLIFLLLLLVLQEEIHQVI